MVLVGLYASPAAHGRYDEAVTELEHALQAAALARADDAAPELVAAALLHDVGHLIEGDLRPIDEPLDGDAHHEGSGARFLRRWFDSAVTDPVALHVAAKRYLCAVEPGYLGALSPSSVRSLEVQGGPMRPVEVRAFRAHARHAEAVALRRWDDRAKVADLPTPPFSEWTSLLDTLVTRE